MDKYFYERSKFSEFKSNANYHQVLTMSDEEFTNWAKLLRKEVIENWDETGTPPVIGRDEIDIIDSFKKLKGNGCDFLERDLTGDTDSLGIIQNFNKDASSVNQFFPTMLKTKISTGKSVDGGVSIYDHFNDPLLLDKFVMIMKRAIRRDSMFAWTRSLADKKDENPFWNGQTPVEFIQQAHEGEIFIGEYSNVDIVLAKVKERTMQNYGTVNSRYAEFANLYLTADEVKHCISSGWLNDTQLINLGDIISSSTSDVGKVTKYFYLIRWYYKDVNIFPKILQVFRLSCGQPAVNFPALTAKYLYELFTKHINQDEPLNIYDSSSGWGGRIIGAMSSRKKILYIGTDPNPDNFIPELGITRYEYVADFYNKNCVDDFSETFGKFFEVTKQSNTFEIFTDGSELIHLNPNFQKYKGKLDFAFTSPPYFARERYGPDDAIAQSWHKFSQYEDWRDGFLYPTIKIIVEYLKNERFAAWNIADIKVGANTYYPLEQDSINAFELYGMEYKGKFKMLMTRMIGLDPTKSGIKNSVKHNNNTYKYEPIFILYKP